MWLSWKKRRLVLEFDRAIVKDESRLINCYFKNGQCHGIVRLISANGSYFYVDFEEGQKGRKAIDFYENGNTKF